MKTFKELLIELDACKEARDWAGDKTIEQVVAEVERGDWLLWLGKKIDLPIRPFTLAKARCAKTVIHLMKDQRSIDAVNVAEKFGLSDEITEDDLRRAYKSVVAAYSTADAAAYTAAYTAAAAAAYTAAAAAADAAAYTAAAAAAARIKNQKQTADICRETIGQLIIDKVNSML